MKKFLYIILASLMVISCIPLMANADDLKPMLAYDFESGNNGTLIGGASVSYDNERNSNVLNLNGNKQYLEFPVGFFDGMDEMTINLDVKSNLDDGNFFTFCYGKDTSKYGFLRVRGYETRFAVTNNSNNNEKVVSSLSAGTGTWHTVSMVVSNAKISLYVNGILTSSMQNNGVSTTNMGTDLVGYLGKSLFDADLYFDGAFDNVEIYDKAMTDDEVMKSVENRIPLISSIIIGTTVDPSTKGNDSHTSSGAVIDYATKTISPYVKKNAKLSSLPILINAINEKCQITIDGKPFENKKSYDLTCEKQLVIKYSDRIEQYTILPAKIAYNSVISGQFADPDIDYIGGKYWMFPTTDGYDWWSGYEFHAFSSNDLINWTDEGVILNTKDTKAGKNSKGVQIATVPWSNCNAWAPTIEEKNGKYYFYFCANNAENDYMAIGVAVANSPAGPYTVKSEPILSVEIKNNQRYLKFNNQTIGTSVFNGQTIDPSVFTEDDGTSYLLFGNGTPCVIKLNSNMQSVDESTFAVVNNGKGLGEYNFCESIYVIKRNGMYHFTWSCNGTDDERYNVAYGTSSTLYGPITFRGTLLWENEKLGILGTAHQSMVYQKELDRCFMAYHRFYTPLGIYTDQYGKHRETCVDEVKFDEKGFMQRVVPSMEAVSINVKPASDCKISTISNKIYNGTVQKPAVVVTNKHTGKAVQSTCYTVSYQNNKNVGKATAVITFKNTYQGTITTDFYILPKVTANKTAYVYNGKSQKPTITITDQKGKLKYTDYTITYPKESKKVGAYSVKISFKKGYDGLPSESISYKINPVATAIRSISAKSKGFTIKWSKKTAEVTGYQIQYSTSSKFTSVKSVYVTSNKTVSKSFGSLAKKKKYYVRIRTYKTVGKTKYYSAWSKAYITTK